MGNLAPPAVQLDSEQSRAHRRQLASALNTANQKLFTPSPVNTNVAASGDASQQIICQGNPVLVVGAVNVAAAATTFSLKRGTTVLQTWGNVSAGATLPFMFIDAPGAGIFTYSTNSGGHTNSASLSIVELK